MSELVPRPERLYPAPTQMPIGVVEAPLSLGERLYNKGYVRKLVVLVALAAAWQVYAVWLGNSLLFPTFVETVRALVDDLGRADLLVKIGRSLSILLTGYAIGIACAAVLCAVATSSRIGADVLETLTAMLNPLPAIALLPLALLWFGLGQGSIVFVLVHSVVWAVALNTHGGFQSVSQTQRMVGRNYGLGRLRYAQVILIPAAFPSILTGLKTGWAFAWRTLIAAEFVFGVSSGQGGLGWFIYESKNRLEIPSVFAGLLAVILIGLLIENGVFRTIEAATVRRWGMQA